MFGCMTDETEDTAPLTHLITTRLETRLSNVRKNGDLRWFRLHSKTQVMDMPVVRQQQIPVQRMVETTTLQFIDKLIDAPGVLRRQVSQVQYNDKMINFPVVMQRHVPAIQTRQNIPEFLHSQNLDQVKNVLVETSQSQFIDRCVEVPTELQRRLPIAAQQQVPMTRRVQKMNMQRRDASIQGTLQLRNLNKPQQPAQETVHEGDRRQREEVEKGVGERE